MKPFQVATLATYRAQLLSMRSEAELVERLGLLTRTLSDLVDSDRGLGQAVEYLADAAASWRSLERAS